MTVKRFNYTGGQQMFTVPAQVTSILCEIWGGGTPYHRTNTGTDGLGNQLWSAGAKVIGTLAVTPGDVLYAYVGADGAASTKAGTAIAPFNGGGLGGRPSVGAPWSGGTGAGASDIRRGGFALSNRLAVAGGAGGEGAGEAGSFSSTTGTTTTAGGTGGVPAGANGVTVTNNAGAMANTQGKGATATAVGAGGSAAGPTGNVTAYAGTAGSGANGGTGGFGANGSNYNGGGGGGGGGYFGGGGGSGFTTNDVYAQGGGGGGGSSYAGGLTSAAFTTQRITTAIDPGYSGKHGFIRLTYNLPPNAPGSLAPTGNPNLDVSIPQVFSWSASDPDGDPQAAAQMQWRVGAAAWTNVLVANDNSQSFTWPASSWQGQVGSSVEYQIRTQDGNGLWGLWSASSYFTPVVAPAIPAITSPTANQAIAVSPFDVTWTSVNQQSAQVRVVADNAGAADATSVAYDSGELASATIRDNQVPLANNSTVHIQVRIRDATSKLWSQWADVKAIVAYTSPGAPLISVNPFPVMKAMISYSNPAPTGSQPAVVGVDIYAVSVANAGGTAIRIAAGLPPAPAGKSLQFAWPVPGEGMSYYAVATGINGTTTKSASSGPVSLGLAGVWLCDPDNVDGTLLQLVYNDHGASENYTIEAVTTHYAGRAYPVVDFGDATDQSLSVGITHVDEDGGTQAALRALVKLRKILLYRDKKGRRLHGMITDHPIEDGWGKGGTTLVITHVDYTEAV